MSEFAFQQALVRLLTDAKMRQAFFAGDPHTFTEAGQSNEEAHRLRNIDPERLEVFAAMVVGQRIQDAAQGLPLTAQLLGDRFSQVALKYNSDIKPEYSKRDDQALAFGRFLQKRFRLEPPTPSFAEDVLAYEMATLELFRRHDEPDFTQASIHVQDLIQNAEDVELQQTIAPYQLSNTRVLRLNHDIVPLIEAMKDGVPPPPSTPQAAYILLRVSAFGVTEQSRINSATAAFIEACDGTASLFEIIERVAQDFQQFATTEFTSKCLSLCHSLVERRIIDFKTIEK